MTYIKGIGDEVISLIIVCFTVIIIIVSWLSTNVREFAFPANLLVIERRSRRLYSTNFSGNVTRIVSHSSQSSPTHNARNNSSNSSTDDPISTVDSSGSNNTNSVSSLHDSSDTTSMFSLNSRNEIVDEIVEQALVENLLEGTVYTTNDIDTVQNSNNNYNSTDQSSAITESPMDITNENNSPELRQISNSEDQTNCLSSNLENSSNKIESITTPDETTNPKDESSPMNILIRFVNEKEMKIKAKPEDTILLLKRTYFGQELSNNKIVRFIYQGQFLCDKNTIKSYNIKDQCTIHCHITTKTNPDQLGENNNSASSNNNNNNSSASILRQRIQNHQISTIARMTGMSSNLNNSSTDQRSNPIPESDNSVIYSANTDNTQDSNPQTSNDQLTNNLNPENRAVNINETATIISIEITNLLLPFGAMLLSSLWYFRVNFKHLFTPFTSLVLLIFTFVYGIILINNIHATTNLRSSNHIFNNRFMRNRSEQNLIRNRATTNTSSQVQQSTNPGTSNDEGFD